MRRGAVAHRLISERSVILSGAYGTSARALLGLAEAFESDLALQPSFKRLMDLAGPNDTLQVLLDSVTWVLIAKAAVGAFGAAFVANLGEGLAQSLRSRLEAKFSKIEKRGEAEISPANIQSFFDALSQNVRDAQKFYKSKNSVIFGIRAEGTCRNIGIELNDPASDADILIAILSIASIAEEIESYIFLHADTIPRNSGANSDLSVKVEFVPDGSVSLVLGAGTQKVRKIIFHSDGVLAEK